MNTRYIPLTAIALVACLAFGTATTSRAEAQKYVIDPDHLSIGFLVMHIGYAKTLGRFREAQGEFTFDEASGELSDIRVTVNTDSVFTDHDKRDNHLRGEDFFNTDQFPEMVFTADKAERTGERSFKITGELTLLGQTNPLVLDMTWNKSAEYPFRPNPIKDKPYVLGASGRGVLKRSDYGMTYAVANGWVGDEVEIIIEFEAQRQ